jgi:predicted transcriptional regulator
VEKNTKDRIIEFLSNRPRGSTICQVSEHLDISRQTASKYLQVLKAEQKIEQREVGKAKLNYIAKELEGSMEAN